MQPESTGQRPELECFRSYVVLLARSYWNPRLQGKLDASDVVQQTLMQAWQRRDDFRGETDLVGAADAARDGAVQRDEHRVCGPRRSCERDRSRGTRRTLEKLTSRHARSVAYSRAAARLSASAWPKRERAQRVSQTTERAGEAASE